MLLIVRTVNYVISNAVVDIKTNVRRKLIVDISKIQQRLNNRALTNPSGSAEESVSLAIVQCTKVDHIESPTFFAYKRCHQECCTMGLTSHCCTSREVHLCVEVDHSCFLQLDSK